MRSNSRYKKARAKDWSGFYWSLFLLSYIFSMVFIYHVGVSSGELKANEQCVERFDRILDKISHYDVEARD